MCNRAPVAEVKDRSGGPAIHNLAGRTPSGRARSHSSLSNSRRALPARSGRRKYTAVFKAGFSVVAVSATDDMETHSACSRIVEQAACVLVSVHTWIRMAVVFINTALAFFRASRIGKLK